MGKAHDSIDTGLRAFIETQHMFFVATAPAAAGHVNLSPKGLDTLRVVSSHELAYLDHISAAARRQSHIFAKTAASYSCCAHSKDRRRSSGLHGRGDVIEPGDQGVQRLSGAVPTDA